MGKQGKYLSKECIIIIAFIIISSALILINLDNSYLWQDEAQTALISKTILTHGMPYGTDGKNYFSQSDGQEYGENYIWKWHTWLQFYLIAFFFKVFGESTFTARLPFALFGIATVPLLYLFAKEMFKDKKIAVFTTIMLIVCVPFMILSRQCRYYSLITFFTLLALHSYLMIINNKKYASQLFIISNFLLYHSHFIYVVPVFSTVLIHSYFFHREKFKKVFILTLITSLLLLPFVLWQLDMKYGSSYGNFLFTLKDTIRKGIRFVKDMASYVLLIYLFLPSLLFIIIFNKFKKKNTSQKDYVSHYILLILFFTLTFIILTLTTQGAFFRYFATLIPLVLIFVGILLFELFKINKVVSVIYIIIAMFLMQFHDYLYEITHVYKGPIGGIVQYLKPKVKPDDLIAISYEDLPLKFYLNCRVVGGLTGEDLKIAGNARFVILRNYYISVLDKKIKETIERNIDFRNYNRIELDCPDYYFENSEDPFFHKFRTIDTSKKVVIYERIF